MQHPVFAYSAYYAKYAKYAMKHASICKITCKNSATSRFHIFCILKYENKCGEYAI
jgi:hypothetical protein